MAWSFVLTLVGLTTQWLIARERASRKGWLLGMVDQLLWAIFALTTGQYGFLASASAYFAVFYKGFQNRSEQNEDQLEVLVLKVEMATKLADCKLARTWKTFRMNRDQRVTYYVRTFKKPELEQLMQEVGLA